MSGSAGGNSRRWCTPLPPPGTGSGALFCPPSSSGVGGSPQPRTAPIAHFASTPNDGIGSTTSGYTGIPTAGRLLAVNSRYIAYAVKKGLVRVIDRRTASKALLRGHGAGTRIVDAAFFGRDADGSSFGGGNESRGDGRGGAAGVAGLRRALAAQRARFAGPDGASDDDDDILDGDCAPANLAAASDVLATVGGAGDEACVLVWRVYGGGGGTDGGGDDVGEMGAEKLLELRFPPACRIAWHPSDPNRFLLMHRNFGWGKADDDSPRFGRRSRTSATLVETTRLVTNPHPKEGHAVCDCRIESSNNKKKNEYSFDDADLPHAARFVVNAGSSDGDGEKGFYGANDVAWSAMDGARYVLTGHDDGLVRLWDVNATNDDGDDDDDENEGSLVRCAAEVDVTTISSDKEEGEVTEKGQLAVTRVLFLSSYAVHPRDVRNAKSGGRRCDPDDAFDTLNVTPPFLTATDANRTVALWSPFSVAVDGARGLLEDVEVVLPPTRLRVFGLRESPAPYLPASPSSLLSLELCPAPYRPPLPGIEGRDGVAVPSSFILMAERKSGTIHALHLDTEWKDGLEYGEEPTPEGVVYVKGFDYVTPLNVVHPAHSFCVAPVVEDNEDEDEDNAGYGGGYGMGGRASLAEVRDVDICCVQSKAVQMLTLSADIVAPSARAGTDEMAPGVTLLHLVDSSAAEDGGDDDVVVDAEFDEEEYDLEDVEVEEENANNEGGASEGDDVDGSANAIPPGLPPFPQPATADGNTDNGDDAFANWLGAIAISNAEAANTIAPPLPRATSSAPPGLGFGAVAPTPAAPGFPTAGLPPGFPVPPPPPHPSLPPGLVGSSPAPSVGASSGVSAPPGIMTFLSPMEILAGNSGSSSNLNTIANGKGSTGDLPNAAASVASVGVPPPPAKKSAPPPPPRVPRPSRQPSPAAAAPSPPAGASPASSNITAPAQTSVAPTATTSKKNKKKKGASSTSNTSPPRKPSTSTGAKGKASISSASPLTILKRKEPPASLASASSASKNIEPPASSTAKTVKSEPAAKDNKQPASAPHAPAVDLKAIEKAVQNAATAHAKSHEAALIAKIQKSVSAEVESALRVASAETKKSVDAALSNALGRKGPVAKQLEEVARESARRAAEEAVAGMREPIVRSLNKTMKEVMIPAYEAATNQMFQQISSSVEQGLAQMELKQADASAPAIEALSLQVMEMGAALRSLHTEVVQLREEGALAAAAAEAARAFVNASPVVGAGAVGPPPLPPVPPAVTIRDEISSFINAQRFEEAFTKAVSASDGDVVVFACKAADTTAVFNNGTAVLLSQPILLCLMQQLGAVLVTSTDGDDLRTELAWLQEIAVTIDPLNENIGRHVAGVVQQLLANINGKMVNCDPVFRRPLQMLMQVIRGLL